MLQLLTDKDTIRFTDGKRIHLNLLKNQIDRRILKITALANSLPSSSRPQTERIFCEKSCQASIDEINFSIEMSQISSKVLGDLNSNDMVVLGNREGKPKYRETNQNQGYLMLADSNLKLGLAKSRQLIGQQAKTQAYPGQDIVKMASCNYSEELNEFNLDLSNIKFDQNISYQQQANELKNYIRNTLSNRKKTMTDRSKTATIHPAKTQKIIVKRHLDAPEVKEPSRFVVSSVCMQKMQDELNKMAGLKRQYQMDYKARTNLLKKIQQKYKNDIV